MPSHPSKASAKKELRKLSKQPMTQAELEVIIKEIVGVRNDRSTAIIGASMIDKSLEVTMLAHFRPLSSDDYGRLFGGDSGPLSTLSAKTKLAYAMNLMTKEIRNEIDCIRDIRNAFAHVLKPLSFESVPIANLCAHLTVPDWVTPRNPHQKINWRHCYLAAVLGTIEAIGMKPEDAERMQLARLLKFGDA